MVQATSPTPSQKTPILLGLALLTVLGIYLHFYWSESSQPYIYAASSGGNPSFAYEVIRSDLSVDWSGGGDFDPKDKCPQDFLGSGFTVIYKKLADGSCFKFLYHKGKKLLYRIDQDLIKGKARIGLHWVTGTAYNSKYRIADTAYKGGRSVAVPNAKGGTDQVRFQYGEAVSKKRARFGRELFHETHIIPGQCKSWWDLINFLP